MKNLLIPFVVIFSLVVTSCDNKDKLGRPVGNANKIMSNANGWWNYHAKYVKLNSDFKSFDANSRVMSNDSFFKSLLTGDYIALKHLPADSSLQYKLYKITPSADQQVSASIKSVSTTDYAHYLMKGKALPGFNYVDLQGNVYNHENTKGKIVVVKCWFIRCKPCVEEMPDLNKLVKKYKDRKDIVFVSLAFDAEKDLKNFLKKREFDYPVVANQEKYMMGELKINSYPTHMIINKQGLVSYVVNQYGDLAPELEREARKM